MDKRWTVGCPMGKEVPFLTTNFVVTIVQICHCHWSVLAQSWFSLSFSQFLTDAIIMHKAGSLRVGSSLDSRCQTTMSSFIRVFLVDITQPYNELNDSSKKTGIPSQSFFSHINTRKVRHNRKSHYRFPSWNYLSQNRPEIKCFFDSVGRKVWCNSLLSSNAPEAQSHQEAI